MERTNKLHIGRQWGLSVLVVVLGVFASPAFPQTDDECVLLVQVTPAKGGAVAPAAGVAHNFERSETIILTAVPRPGYHFVHWLGDVSEVTANNTTITLNTPKIVIAVFAPDEFGFLVEDTMAVSAMSGGVGGQRLSRKSVEAGRGAPGGAARKEREKVGYGYDYEYELGTLTIKEEPVPEDEIETLIIKEEPIPEPSTVVLFALGGLVLLRRRTHSKNA